MSLPVPFRNWFIGSLLRAITQACLSQSSTRLPPPSKCSMPAATRWAALRHYWEVPKVTIQRPTSAPASCHPFVPRSAPHQLAGSRCRSERTSRARKFYGSITGRHSHYTGSLRAIPENSGLDEWRAPDHKIVAFHTVASTCPSIFMSKLSARLSPARAVWFTSCPRRVHSPKSFRR